MALQASRFYFTDSLFIRDVLHLSIPYPEFFKVIVLFILLFFLPLTFRKSPLDRRIAHVLHLLFDTIVSIITPKQFLQNSRKLIRCFSNASLIAFLVFATKPYVTYIGVTVEKEPIAFNQPVIYRAEVKPWETHCKLMNRTTERQYLMWEVQHCSKTKRTHGYHKTFYVPSVRTVDGSEQLCLPKHKSSAIGRVEFCEAPPVSKDSGRSYEHPVEKIRDDCKQMGTNCDLIKRAVSHEGSTYIEVAQEWLRSQTQKWLRVDHLMRSGFEYYAIREVVLALEKEGGTAPSADYVRTAFAVNQAVEYSRCFAKSNFVDTIKVSNLVIHLVPLIFLFVLEHICRHFFERLVDTTPEDTKGYDEHLNVVVGEALSS